MRDNIAIHLISLRQQSGEYLPVTAEMNNRIKKQFYVEISELSKDFTVGEKEKFIELLLLENSPCCTRIMQHSEYPALSDKAVRFLLL